MNLFTASLGEPMTSDVEMQKPGDIQAAMSLARAFERHASVANSTSTSTLTRAPYRPRPTVSAMGSTTTSTPTTTPAGATSSKSRFRRLSPEEMVDKRKCGECYFYPEKFSVDHKCAMKGIFLMELEEEDDAAALADDLGISLHRLTGLTGANTMQLFVNIAGKELCALVDSGSTHMFIHDVVVHALGLNVTLQPGLSVKVANGERLQSYGACKATKVLVQGESFVMNCYALPLEGFDVILGVQWLKSLGPIMWDFAVLTMAFVREGRSVHLVGCGGTTSAL
jgi:hypothetical protein